MKLKRSWKVKSFTKGLELFQLIADIAEAEGTLHYVFTQCRSLVGDYDCVIDLHGDFRFYMDE